MGIGKVFKRKLYDKMLDWKQTRDGSTALLIKGARRVGKSTIAEEAHKSLDEFCKKYSQHISNRYLVYTKDFRKDNETILLPIFLTLFL